MVGKRVLNAVVGSAGRTPLQIHSPEGVALKPEQTYKVTMELTGKQVVLLSRGMNFSRFADTFREQEAEEVWQIFYDAVAEVAGEW